jgi:hypothetical protein
VPTLTPTKVVTEAISRLFVRAERNSWAWLSAGEPPMVRSKNRWKLMWAGIHDSGRASKSTLSATLEIRSQVNGPRITISAIAMPA